MQILVVDDDAETLEVVGRALERDGHAPTLVLTADEAWLALGSSRFDVIVLDVMLADSSGLTLCAELRRGGSETPVLFLSARGAVNARVEGLDVGGDDYLAKPFAIRELLARVRALGRRVPVLRPTVLRAGTLALDFTTRRASAQGAELPVTAREWDLLRVLADAQGRVVSFDDVLDRVWGESSDRARASLEVIMSRLRKKLDTGAGRPVLRTARGLGYALEVDA